ncbi:MAG: iron-containing alcohol dehydrogenase, partial [Sedimentisphaerales bacterium]|nr:iron-containing alcohol dehydrogenase [Sedimentisphaerales bacterium]
MPTIDWSCQQRYLGKTFSCSCGRAHTLGLREIVYADDALERLPDVCGNHVKGKRVVVIADARTWQAAGRRAFEALQKENWPVEFHIVADDESGSPVCDQATRERLAAELAPADWLLAVGSGVINDLTKWTAFDGGIPYAVVATAASMNGYAAANVATCIEGVKGLFFARPPFAIFAQPRIIRDAPFALTAAGFGDQMAKPVSIADWILNHVLFDEYLCPTVCDLITEGQNQDMSHPEGIRAREPRALEALFASLVLSGIAMTLVGSSAPASGGEHLLSHTLDMMAPVYHRPHDLHGRQVGLGCIFAAALYEKIVRIDRPSWQPPPP